tara:strand:+ start:472 stop:831 length:360 start_codon:yes stop_codon:yes gene_type:complete
MKKGLIVGIVIILAVILVVAFYPSENESDVFNEESEETEETEGCIGEGDRKDAILNEQCCEGLTPVSSCFFYQPEYEGTGAEENGCVRTLGCMTSICSDCGNDLCEGLENRCNCPADCL